MYAIVDIKGKQFKVEKDQTLEVPKLNDKVGAKVEFSKVLLVNDNGKISTAASMKITAEIISHELNDKVTVFKLKRRKGYQKKNGHKQPYTVVKIKNLKANTAKKTEKKETNEKKTASKKTTKKKD